MVILRDIWILDFAVRVFRGWMVDFGTEEERAEWF